MRLPWITDGFRDRGQNNTAMAKTLRESFSGRNRTRDQPAKRGALVLLEISLYVRSPTSVEGTIQTSKCSMREGPSGEIARLRITWLSFQFRVYSLWHAPKQLFLIRWPEQAK
jgi:hypothetical protein